MLGCGDRRSDARCWLHQLERQVWSAADVSLRLTTHASVGAAGGDGSDRIFLRRELLCEQPLRNSHDETSHDAKMLNSCRRRRRQAWRECLIMTLETGVETEKERESREREARGGIT